MSSRQQASSSARASRVEDMVNKVFVEKHAPAHTSSYAALRAPASTEENVLSHLSEPVQINILQASDEEVVFDLVGVDASIANALRRVMISEVPTMAIEYVFIQNNTSVMQDEVLSHRLGLVPIIADTNFFDPFEKTSENLADDFTDLNTIKFVLDVRCKRDASAKEGSDAFIDSEVYSRDLKFVPEGVQNDWIRAHPQSTPRVAYGDILLCKLRPGQSMKLTCFATKNIGREHAKWSPVAPASYRLLPEIRLTDRNGRPRVLNEEADELKALCPLEVFDIEDMGDGNRAAVAARPRNCTMCRECIRDEKWHGKVELSRVKNHYIFSVESTLVIPAPDIVRRALEVLTGKCQTLLDEVTQMKSRQNDDDQ